EVIAVPELRDGVVTVAQANGFAGLDSNTMMFAWRNGDVAMLGRLLRLTRKLGRLQKCTLIHRPAPHDPNAAEVVVWWKGRESNGDLMLLLAHLACQGHELRSARIVLKSIVDTEEDARTRRAEFAAMLPDIRIDAGVEVIVRSEGRAIGAIVREHSQGARLVFLGMSEPGPGEEQIGRAHV